MFTLSDFTINQLIHMVRLYNTYFPNKKLIYSGKSKKELVQQCNKKMIVMNEKVLSKENPHYELNLMVVSTKVKPS